MSFIECYNLINNVSDANINKFDYINESDFNITNNLNEEEIYLDIDDSNLED